MLVYLLDADELDLTRAYLVNRAIRSTEANGPLTRTRPFQRLVVKAGNLADALEPSCFDGLDPCRELCRDERRYEPQLLAGTRGEHDDMNREPLVYTREVNAQGRESTWRSATLCIVCARVVRNDRIGGARVVHRCINRIVEQVAADACA